MWFIDKSLIKNKNFYLQEMQKFQKDYQCKSYLFYGEELFNGSLCDFDKEIWREVLEYLEKWKAGLPDMPEINFDKNANTTFEEIKDISPTIYRKLLTNVDVITQIFPIIFPEKRVLNLLHTYFKTKNQQIYRTLCHYIERIV